MNRILLAVATLWTTLCPAYGGNGGSIMSSGGNQYTQYTQYVPPAPSLQDLRNQFFHFANNYGSSTSSRAMISEVGFNWLRNELSGISNRTVFLGLGNPNDRLSAAQEEKISVLVKDFVEHNILIIYDADSLSAPVIEKAAPKKSRLGISGNSFRMSEYTLFIPDSAMRFRAMSLPRVSIISLDSIIGVGLFIGNSTTKKSKFFVYDSSFSLLPPSLNHLAEATKNSVPETFQDPTSLRAKVMSTLGTPMIAFSAVKSLSSIDYRDEIFSYSRTDLQTSLNYYKGLSDFYRSLRYEAGNTISILGADVEPQIQDAFDAVDGELATSLSEYASENKYVAVTNGNGSLIQSIGAQFKQESASAYGMFNAESPEIEMNSDKFTTSYRIRTAELRLSLLLKQPIIFLTGVDSGTLRQIGTYFIKAGVDSHFTQSLSFLGGTKNWLKESDLLLLPLPAPFTQNLSSPQTVQAAVDILVQAPRFHGFYLRHSTIEAPLLSQSERAMVREEKRLTEERKRLALEERRKEEEAKRLREEARRKQEEIRRKEEEARRQKEEAERAAMMRKTILANIANTSKEAQVYSTELKSRMATDWIKKAIQRVDKTVFLGIGNPDTILSQNELFQLDRLLGELKQKSISVLYDADSTTASSIERSISPNNRLGITGNRTKEDKRVIFIGNPYLRMTTILSCNLLIVSPSSALGAGLILEDFSKARSKIAVFDPLHQWPDAGLARWSQGLDNLWAESSAPVEEAATIRTELLASAPPPSVTSTETNPEPALPTPSLVELSQVQSTTTDLPEASLQVTEEQSTVAIDLNQQTPTDEASIEKKAEAQPAASKKKSPGRVSRWYRKMAKRGTKLRESGSQLAGSIVAELLFPGLSSQPARNNPPSPNIVTSEKDKESVPAPSTFQGFVRERRTKLENLGISYPFESEPRSYAWPYDLISWLDKKLEPSNNYGYSFYDYRDAMERKKVNIALPEYQESDFLNSLNNYDLNLLLNQARTYEADVKFMTHEASQNPNDLTPLLPTGVVVFGSARGSSNYEPMIEEVVEAIARTGMPVATGGSGGFMRTANHVAKKLNAPSIGIPMGGGMGNSLVHERVTYDGDQTHTIHASDYSTRIPYLLHDRKFTLIVPGGSGTMKELATTLVQLSSMGRDEAKTTIVFVNSAYYRALFQWFHSLPLSESVKERIKLVDTGEAMSELLVGAGAQAQYY